MPFRICSIGCGGMSTFAHGPSFARYAASRPDTLLAACCDLDESKAVVYRDCFGFARHYNDFVRMLDAERPDAVSLVVQEPQTCEIACGILEMGYPLIMEKPPGTTVEEVDRMIAAAARRNVPNRVAFNRRYTPLVRRLKAEIAGECFREQALHLRYEFTRVNRTDADFTLTAIHGIDAARFIAGSDYAHIRFHYRELPERGPTTANVLMQCVFESGATGHIEFLPVTGASTERAAVYLHDHTFFLEIAMFNEAHPLGLLRHFDRDSMMLAVRDPETPDAEEKFVVNGFYAENESFFDDVRARRRPEGDLADARQSVEVMQCMRDRMAEYSKA